MHDCSSNSLDDWFRAISIAYLNSASAAATSVPEPVASIAAFLQRILASNATAPVRADASSVSSNSSDRLRLSAGPCENIRHQAVDIRGFPSRPQRMQRGNRFRKRIQPVRDVPLPGGQPSEHASAKREILRKRLLTRRGDEDFCVVAASRLVAERLTCSRRGGQRHRIGKRRRAKPSRSFDRLLGVRDRRLGVSKMGQRVGQICRGSDIGRGRDGEIRQVPSVIVAKIERAGETIPCGIQPALIKGQDAKPDVAGDRDAVVLVATRRGQADWR